MQITHEWREFFRKIFADHLEHINPLTLIFIKKLSELFTANALLTGNLKGHVFAAF